MFPRAFERIGVSFYRSKITSWMAAQEEDYRCNPEDPHCHTMHRRQQGLQQTWCFFSQYVCKCCGCHRALNRMIYLASTCKARWPLPRFIILEADGEMSPWSRLCVSQADCVLLVAAPDASPEVCPDGRCFSLWLCLHFGICSCALLWLDRRHSAVCELLLAWHLGAEHLILRAALEAQCRQASSRLRPSQQCATQMGNLERQLLWATIDASRRRSQRAAQPSGKLVVSVCCISGNLAPLQLAAM